MNKNDYRRAFIMLRPAAPGWAGHVRIEHRVMTGSMYFIVNPPAHNGEILAALAGRRGQEYYAASLGALRADSRGQFTLAYPFDPRLIEGRPLDAYPWIAIARIDEGGCRVVLTGNVDGAYPMDIGAVQEAIRALYRGGELAAELPGPEEPLPPPPKAAAADEPGLSANEPPRTAAEAADESLFASAEVRPEGTAAEDPASALEAQAAPPPLPFIADVGEALSPAEIMEGASRASIAPEAEADGSDAISETAEPPAGPAQNADVLEESPAEEAPAPVEADTGAPADGYGPATRIYTRMRLGGTPSVEPPDDCRPACPVPERAEIAVPSPAPRTPEEGIIGSGAPARPCAMPLEDGYAYVRVPLPAACGISHCLIGIQVDDGRLASVRAALPGRYAPQPPEGLEGGIWVGAGDGSGAGYWVYTARMQ